MLKYFAAALVLCSTPGWADPEVRAQAPSMGSRDASAALRARAAELVPMLNGGGDPATMFHPTFLAQIPSAKVREIGAQVTAGFGKATSVVSFVPGTQNGGIATIATERGTLAIELAVEEKAPHRITSLRIVNATSAEASLPAVVDALKALPGRTNFALYELGSSTPTLISGFEAERPLPVGSAFKLVILGELVRVIASGERRWEDTVTLDGRELPGGAYAKSPKGTQLSLRSLAEKMISVSDNGATDLLLNALGRKKVEAMQRKLAIADPSLNRPFLSTMEFFKLKAAAPLRDRWIGANERGRRAMLAEVNRAPSTELAALFRAGNPVAPDRVEWFLSPLDLARTMDWLRRNTESGPAADARRILALNPGIPPQLAARYGYVGYKGGSEPGVMNMTLLLQSKAGGWRVLTASWLNTQARVDEGRFAMLVSRAAELAVQ